VLARLAARELGTTAVRLLRRRDSGQAQRSQDRTGRERLSQNRFLARPYRAPVIVVDDVVTTGTSLLVSCEALRRSGITVVAVAVIGDANLARKP
jgi:phosphoribosyl transferase domain